MICLYFSSVVLTEDDIHLDLFLTHQIGMLQINRQMATYQSEMNCYDYTMRFIGYDSIQTRWFISYCFQIGKIT